MKPAALILSLAFLQITSVVIAQTPASSPPSTVGDSKAQAPAQAPATTAQQEQKKTQPAARPGAQTKPDVEVRPDAVYAKPSGQDSRPKQSNVIRHSTAPTAQSAADPGKRTAQESGTSPKTYDGSSGKKQDVGTGCSTARRKPNGELDCGTGGAGAVPGKVPK